MFRRFQIKCLDSTTLAEKEEESYREPKQSSKRQENSIFVNATFKRKLLYQNNLLSLFGLIDRKNL